MMKWLISGAILLGFTGVCEYVYLCPVTEVICPDDTNVQITEEKEEVNPETTETPQKELLPLSFSWKDFEPQQNQGIEDYKSEILKGNIDNNLLVITGLYAPEEIGEFDGHTNLGLARADRLAKLFEGDIPRDRIQIRAQKQENLTDGDTTNQFSAATFAWETPTASEEEIRVVELADRQLVYFPSNSTERLHDPKLESYLTEFAEKLKAEDSRVTLIGHTDAQGEPAFNLTLGKRRAETLKSLLLEKGVAEEKIEVISRGETEPRAENDTEKGRAENRRVEIVIKK